MSHPWRYSMSSDRVFEKREESDRNDTRSAGCFMELTVKPRGHEGATRTKDIWLVSDFS